MAKRKKAEEPLSKKGVIVFQDPRDPDFDAWQGPTVAELVAQAVAPTEEDAEEFKPITIRPTVQEVALLDELAKLFSESRNMTARHLLVAAMRDALRALPTEHRERVQAQAFKRLGWGVMTPERLREVNERGARGEGTKLSELLGAPDWLDDPNVRPVDRKKLDAEMRRREPVVTDDTKTDEGSGGT